MTAAVDLSVLPVTELLLGCLAQEIAKVADPPASVCLRPGDAVELFVSTSRDECCEGLAWVRVVGIVSSTDFPAPDQVPLRCPPGQLAVVLEMGVARCAPTPPANAIPTCDQWTDTTRAVLGDAAAMRRALCCFILLEPDRLVVTGPWLPLPVDGGCVGSTVQITVAVDNCDCTDDD